MQKLPNLFYVLSASLCCMLLFACNDRMSQQTEMPNPNPPEPTESFTYLALGDSYTIGESVREELRYPVQLASALQTDFEVEVPHIIAQTGWTTSNLQAGITADNELATSYDLVSLLIGVNNQYQGRSLEEYRVEFEELLDQAIVLAGGNKDRVFVISIPDYAYTPFGNGNANISEQIDEFNAANLDITTEKEVTYFDITPISREGLNDPELVAEDGLHPSGKQYEAWMNFMLEGVKELLRD